MGIHVTMKLLIATLLVLCAVVDARHHPKTPHNKHMVHHPSHKALEEETISLGCAGHIMNKCWQWAAEEQANGEYYAYIAFLQPPHGPVQDHSIGTSFKCVGRNQINIRCEFT